jgi:hypothetical protein
VERLRLYRKRVRGLKLPDIHQIDQLSLLLLAWVTAV